MLLSLAIFITACLALDRKEQLKKIWKHPDFKSFDHFWNESYGHDKLIKDLDKTWMMMWMLEERAICILENICPTPRKSIINNPVACEDGIARVPNGQGGFIEYPCNKVSLESFVSLLDLGSGATADGNDIWGYEDEEGRRYVISGQTDGASIVDITDPANPDVLVFIPSTAYPNNILWRDMKITDNRYLYIVADGTGHGLQSMALDPLIAKGRVTSGIYVAQGGGVDYWTSNAIGNSHNIVSLPSKNVVYSVGSRNNQNSAGGIIRYVTNPETGQPVVSGVYSDALYTHDAECVIYNGPDQDYVGKEVCFGYQGGNPNELLVAYWNEDSAEFEMITRTPYEFASYTHQGWITDDHRFLLMNDEADESREGFNTRTIIVNLGNDLDTQPTFDYYFGETAAIDHNLYIVDDHVYEANYKAGLRVIKLEEQTEGKLTLNEVASFQTWTQGPINAAFNGAWSSYPFWVKETCIVAVQDIEQGLFILKVDADLGICGQQSTK